MASSNSLPQPRAIEVRPNIISAPPLADSPGVSERHDGAIKGILKANDAGRAGMNIIRENSVSGNVSEGEVVGVLGTDAGDEGAGEGGDAAGLVGEDVGAVVGEDGVRGLGEVGAERELVAHCAGEDEEGGGVRG